MMNNLEQEAKKIRLSVEEKASMKARIFGVPSYAPTPSQYFFFSHQFRTAFAGLVLVVFVGAGTASAAQGALPGDVLYPIKVSITEKVEVALAPTPAAKAQIEVKLATRRVAEAQTLQALGRLDATTTREIEDNFDTHAAQALALAPLPKEPKQDRKASAPRATMALKVAALAPEATSSEEVAVVASSTENTQENNQEQKDQEEVSASLEVQKQIFKAIKIRARDRQDRKNSSDGEIEIKVIR